MSQKIPEGAPNLFPFLTYRDANAALRFLSEAFGFEERVVYRAPDGSVAHAELRLGPGIIMIGSVKKEHVLGLKSTLDLGGVSQGVYVYVRDVEAHHARAKAAGATIIRPLQDTDYGSREYVAKDTEGNLWSFGTYWPDPNSKA